MKIVLTGGGTGGHFYPIIAVAEELRKTQKEEGIAEMELIFASSEVYNRDELERLSIHYKKIKSGKIRTYASIQTFFDIFRTMWGCIQALFYILYVYPDAVFGKGGHSSFPTLFAARVLGVPVIIHESDSVPGRVNVWAGKFARRVFLSFPEAGKYFPEEKTMVSGRPIPEEIIDPQKVEGSREFLHIHDESVPVILVLGGSQGSDAINSVVIEAIEKLVDKYYIIHQTGKDHIKAVKVTAEQILKNSENADRYMPFDYFDLDGMRRVSYLADLVISRAGSTLFEIAAWGKPSILVPYTYAHGNHQYHNAFSYARSGACRVIEEPNLSSSLLIMEIDNILEDSKTKEEMEKAAKGFHKPGAARDIAVFLSEIGVSHEK
ncbi:MAG: undecaprenyldiphospho-muramoylpentapeptide beta-N-acetylglucosaminyltransferase [Patescibacteria group bacterium]